MSEGEVRLLGPVQFVTGTGEVIDLPSATQRRLLAVLGLAAGATLRMDHLADVLETSPGALRTVVSRLRARVGDDVIRTDAIGYRLDCAVDATAVTELIAGAQEDRLPALDCALARWHGEALDEFRHEPWAEAEVARLDELHAIAVEDRAETLIRRGRAAEAVAALEAHVLRAPLRDRPRGLLMRALAADGRQAEALRVYQDYRSHLVAETGTEPSAAVQAIERQVASGSVDAPEATRPLDLPLDPVLASGAPLIGRRRERAWLDSALAEARTGSSTAVLLSGEPGIGKTTLLASFARRHPDVTVLYGRCAEGAAVPLQPFRSIVQTAVDHAPEAMLREHVERRGGELARLAPRLEGPPPTTGDDATERFLLFEAVVDLLRRVAAAGPLVLVLDDLHWAEPTALLLLRHLSRSLQGVPVMLAVSWRDTEDEPADLRNAFADLDRAGARRVRLTGFDDDELTDLVASITDELGPAIVDELRTETDGNPLYASHLVRHLVESEASDEVPPSLEDVLWSRVHALGDEAAALLRVGSVLGTEFSESLLAEVGEQAVGRPLDAAVDAGLLDGSAGTWRFTHALVAHALYADLGDAARRGLHRRAATVLEREVEPDAVALARHWEGAADLDAALRWATVAGDRALADLAAAEAATWYGRALAHARSLGRPGEVQADLMVCLGVAQLRAGDPGARATVVEAGRVAVAVGADDVLVRAALANEHIVARIGAVDEDVLRLVESALAVVDREDTSSYAVLLAIYALQLMHTPRAELRQQVAREALDLVEAGADAAVLPRMVSALQFALWGPGALPLRRELADRAATIAAAGDDPFLRFWTSRAALYVAIESADAPASGAALGRMRAAADEVGEPALQWVVGVADVFDLTMRARFEESDRLSERVLALGTEIGEPEAFSIYAGQLFVNRSFAGRYEELIPLLEQVLEATPDVLPFRLAHAISCAVVGRTEEAAAVLATGASAGFGHVPRDFLWMTTILGYAVLAIELEASGAAAELYPILEPFGREVAFNGATSQGHIGAYLGKLASLLGEHDLADEHLHRALEVNLAFGWEYHEATTLVALAQSEQRRTGALDVAAAAWLDRASAIADERGLAGVSAQVARLR